MSLPLLRLNYLDMLRGFVAVGRRMSITLASDDLCLTQSAVSRQINTLEKALGFSLFVRGYRNISFTPEGERLFRTADGVIQQLQDVLGTLSDRPERRPVTVTTSIGVSALWLLPRLGRFQQAHPGIDVRIAATNKMLDMNRDAIDLAIRYGAWSTAPASATRLFGEKVAPVAHPSLGLRGKNLKSALKSSVLIEFDDPKRPWLQWSEALDTRGLGSLRPKGVLRFNRYDQVIQACVSGQGVALGRLALTGAMLTDGRLELLETRAPVEVRDYGYWLLRTPETASSDVNTVADWIASEAQTPAVNMSSGGE